MKSHPDHLPDKKQRELQRVIQILHEELAEKVSTANQREKKNGRILKVILFGSYARGGWVEDPVGGYYSDYDLLVIVSHKKLTDVVSYWSAAEDRIRYDPGIRRAVNFIVHTLDEVNEELKKAQYFFSDIYNEGVLLYELREKTASGKPKHKLIEPEPVDEKQALVLAKKYFNTRLPYAAYHGELARKALADGMLKHAAFEFHQTVEHAYGAFLLTKTLYLPKSHNIEWLRSLAEDMEPALRDAWPRDQKDYRRSFQLLKRAYVEARYSESYEISRETIEWLEDRVSKLLSLIKMTCRAHLGSDT